MKTLAQLKRDLKVGKKLKTIYHKFGQSRYYDREIVAVHSNSISTSPVESNLKVRPKVQLDLPKASLLEYEGNQFTIYSIGYRKLTEEEEKFYNNRPSNREENKEQLEIDLLTDSNTVYCMDLSYFEHSKYKYIWTNRTWRGHDYMELADSKVKGEKLYTFEIVD